MARINTLTAYRCKFSYMQRNNPLIDKQREDIRIGKKPEFSFSDFVTLYSQNSGDILVGKNSDRAISLSDDKVRLRSLGKTKSWCLLPIAGKQGQPMTVVKRSNGKRYNFGADAAALYNYYIFVYENENGIVAIFHRQNGSGCKSVFLETANNILREKGLKLEMDLIIPLSGEANDILPTKITLQYVERNDSSDIADNLRKRKKVIKDMGFNLEVQNYSKLANIVRNMQLKRCSKDSAFALILSEIGGDGDYNDAEVKFKIGNRTKSFSWNNLDHIVGAHDVSAKLHIAYKKSGDFIGELAKLSDEYFTKIEQSGVSNDE